jgi:vacuolar protein sorting-associated protein 52
LNVRLENRKAIEKALGPVVEELSVSPLVVSKIVDGHLDETWIKALAEVDKKATAYKKDASAPTQSKAWADLGPLLDKLILKVGSVPGLWRIAFGNAGMSNTLQAIERIRDYMVTQIKAVRSPNINAQIIQHQYFIRQKDAFAFLYKHHAQLGDEICLAYMNTMRWYYLNQFTRYQKALEKMKLHILDKTDLLGHDENSRSKAASLLSGSRAVGPPHDAFNLGRRIDLLKTNNQTALPSYLAEEATTTHYLEVPFRNFNLALVDNASAEYTFLTGFFSPAMSLGKISKHFNYIFEPTFSLGQQLTKALVLDTYDGLALLLCIRLNQHFAFELQRRKVPCVDGYINATNMLLWPRLQVVMDHNCESVRALANATPSKPGKTSVISSAAPHITTQRFGQLLHGILALSAEAGDDEPVVTSLRRLRAEMEAFLTKQAKASYADMRKQERFLYNNYSLILTIISDTDGKLAVEQQQHFENLKTGFREGA